jgi:DNA polymerase elongation subunit (family B)
VVVERDAFAPFLLVADAALVAGAAGRVDLVPLDGAGALRWVARFASWRDALAAHDRCRQRSGPTPDALAPPFHFLADPVHQYLLWTGRTSFRGMAFGDLRRLALDIEVVTTDGFEFPSAARPGDRIVAIALADSDGFREVLRGDRLDERALLEACGRVLRERDPDVIEGHNIFRFDLEYLESRARMHGVPLAWGRDGSLLRGRPARMQVGERGIGFRWYAVAGRHVVDTWMLAQLHDVGARDLPSFGLKDVARHFGVAAVGRTYVDGSAVTREFAETPDRLMAYALDDVVETLAVAGILAPPYFAQAQVVPFDYQSTVLRGAAAKIDRLLLREYLHRRRAVPHPAPPSAVGGGLVAMFRQGVAQPALHVDVTSLYPSLMLARGIAPASDELGVFLALLGHLRDFRVEAKHRAAEARAPEDREHLHALQQAFKILINAFYGYLAYGGGHWNDYRAADRVTAEGRDVVRTMVERLEARGCVPVEADTDGVYFVPPPGHRPADDEALLAGVAAALPAGIRLELDGRYAAMLSYKQKTYALLDERGSLSLKGSAFRSRGLEPFQRRLIEEIVRLLVAGRGPDVKGVVDRWMADFAARRVSPRLFARTETLGDALDTYRDRVAAGERHPSAAYELAVASGRVWQPGDQVSYYVAGRGAGVTVSECARLLSEWNPARPDENVDYYQAKVSEIWARFRRFTEREGLWAPAEDPEPPDQLALF